MKKILVVDDDQAILDALEITLVDAGYEVKTNMKGDKTPELARQFNPDVILLDVLISGSDGREIAKLLKSDNELKDIPIIMLSAHPTADKTIHDTGANDFIPKPFDIDQLLELVEKHISK